MRRNLIRRFVLLAVAVCFGTLVGCAETDPGAEGQCVGPNCGDAGSDAGGCDANSDCAPGSVCESGTCQPAEGCSRDEDCAGDRVCMGGSCYEPDRDSGPVDSYSGEDTTSGDTETPDAGDTGTPDGDGGGSCGGCYLETDAGDRRCVAGDQSEACGTGGVTCKTCQTDEVCENGTCQPKPCTPANCNGCCKNGECKQGDTDQACGTGGATCNECGSDSTCENGSCELTCAATCDGCCDSDGNCVTNPTDNSCGTGGEACASCEFDETCQNGRCTLEACSERCSRGCCDGSSCESGLDDNACGSGGDACVPCEPGFTCKSLGALAGGGYCSVKDGSRWDVIAVRGEVPKDRKVYGSRGTTRDAKWDSFSKPDVRLHVKTEGATQTFKAKTSVDKDDLTPEWSDTTISDVRADDLQRFDKTELKLMDDDVLADDHIATCKTQFYSYMFDGDVYEFECKQEHAGETITTKVYLRLQHHP